MAGGGEGGKRVGMEEEEGGRGGREGRVGMEEEEGGGEGGRRDCSRGKGAHQQPCSGWCVCLLCCHPDLTSG